MFRRVIVGVDGRPSGRDAIALARMLAAPRDGHVSLAHVHVVTPIAASSRDYEDPETNPSQRLLEQERGKTGIDADLIAIVASSVGRGLHSLCESEGADLLVVGSCHRGVVGRVLVGNDTKGSLNGAACAVAVAPLDYERDAGKLATVGVGYDGGPDSQAALVLAREVAAEHAAKVRVLQVVSIPSLAAVGPSGAAFGDLLNALRDEAEQGLAALPDVEHEVVIGVPGEELAAFAGRVDLLVVGSRGYGPLKRLVLGSTSEHLAGHARCALLVLPRTATEAGGGS